MSAIHASKLLQHPNHGKINILSLLIRGFPLSKKRSKRNDNSDEEKKGKNINEEEDDLIDETLIK